MSADERPPIPPEHRPIICRVVELLRQWAVEQGLGESPAAPAEPAEESVPGRKRASKKARRRSL